MATNREFFSGRMLENALRQYGDDVAKGFDKGLEEWLDFPHFEAEYTYRDGAMYMKGKEYKGKFYTHEEFKRYQKEGMLPDTAPKKSVPLAAFPCFMSKGASW